MLIGLRSSAAGTAFPTLLPAAPVSSKRHQAVLRAVCAGFGFVRRLIGLAVRAWAPNLRFVLVERLVYDACQVWCTSVASERLCL